MAVQYAHYHFILQKPVRSGDLEAARPAIGRWIKVVLAWQVVVVIAAGVYVAALASRHPQGVVWVAPAIGAVFGTALPLQVAVVALMRLRPR
jgi:hypothetical protein